MGVKNAPPNRARLDTAIRFPRSYKVFGSANRPFGALSDQCWAYVNEVEISHAGVDQGFERRQPYPLNDSRPQQAFVVCTGGTSPSAGDDYENGTQ